MKFASRFVILSIIGFALLLSGCDPTRYAAPVKTFNETMDGSKQIYFDQLKDCHESYVERNNVRLKLYMIANDGYIGSTEYEGTKKKLLDMANASHIPAKSLEARNRAFKILEYYGTTLGALASDEKTDALKTELTGFSTDTTAFAKNLEKISDLSESFEFLESATKWAGYIGDAIGVINKLVELVADYYREKALKEAIITSHQKIVKLIGILKSEAVTAAEFRAKYFQDVSMTCSTVLKNHEGAGSVKQYLIADICNDIEIAKGKLIAPKEIEEAFTLVINSHTEMEKMAQGGAYDQMVEKINEFRDRLEKIKTKFEFLGN